MPEKQAPPPTSHVAGEHGKIELPTTYVGKQPKPGTNPIGGGFRVPPTRPGGIGSGLTLNEQLRRETRDNIKVTESSVKAEHSAKLQNLPGSTEIDLANLRAQHPISITSPTQAYQHELNIRNLLIQQKTAELHTQTSVANSFYGHSPIGKTIGDYLAKAQTLERPVTPYGPVYARWVASYKAAYSANFLTEQIQLLHTQQIHVQNLLVATQAQEQRQLEAEREAHRVAAELARVNEEAAARAREQARLAALENARRVAEEQAREQARLAALESARQLAAEQARITAEAAARQVAAERALLEAQAEVKRQEEQAKEAKEREEANAKKQVENLARLNEMAAMYKAWEASRASRPFPVLGWSAAAGPVFTLENGRLAAGAATTQAVRTALQTSVTTVVTASTAAASAVMVGFAALLFPSPLGNGERPQLSARLSSLVPDNVHTWDLSITEYEPDNLHALSIPLSDLTTDIDDLHAVAKANGKVRLPVAIGSRKEGNSTEYFVVTTNGTSVPGDVPVRLATFDSDLNVYRSYNPDAPSIGIAWTPIVKPGDASTTLPASEPNIAVYDGTALTALEGRLDEFPELDLYSFGGFITVFPTESGLPPIFTMFRDRRDEPGVASGYGDPVSGIWLEPASKGIGAVIPNQIAGKLREQNFSNFRSFRETFWRSIVEDPALAKQFTTQNIQQMKNGRAPFSHKKDWVGGKIKFELHHLHSVSDGGDVYDFDNIRVVTPKLHTELHKGGN
ncbi:S-type pyocin domain-containing protein [Pseudomonas sp. GL-B-19]|uniref:S-type pyocin domain-containing protein n=1 Tax=Pseudomonas sp. GL-B-19 TaxID=2832393 RepID=UPI001CBB25B3|nr:S-type pyocin domain-containing protein [Pseudomonas sp. GL-B-19]